MTDAKQPDPLALADEAWNFDCSKYRGARHANAAMMGKMQDCADMIRKLHAELETLRAKIKTYEDLGDAADDVQLLRMGYAAARMEIESLRKERADELAVAYMCGASREKELAASQQAVQEPAYPSLPPADEVVHPRTSEPYALWGLMKLMDYAKAYHAANAPQPSPAAQGDALDAERWRMAALVGNEVMVHPDKRNHAAAVAAYMQAVSSGLDLTAAIDAARAAQGGK